MRLIFPREGMESRSIRNLTSSWSYSPLPLPQTGVSHQVPRVTNNWFLCKTLCWQRCIWVRECGTPGFLNLQRENNSNPNFTGLLCKHNLGEGFVHS